MLVQDFNNHHHLFTHPTNLHPSKWPNHCCSFHFTKKLSIKDNSELRRKTYSLAIFQTNKNLENNKKTGECLLFHRVTFSVTNGKVQMYATWIHIHTCNKCKTKACIQSQELNCYWNWISAHLSLIIGDQATGF